jgi:hypothetical protein
MLEPGRLLRVETFLFGFLDEHYFLWRPGYHLRSSVASAKHDAHLMRLHDVLNCCSGQAGSAIRLHEEKNPRGEFPRRKIPGEQIPGGAACAASKPRAFISERT